MAFKGLANLSRHFGGLTLRNQDPLAQCLAPGLSRSMATEASMPSPSSTIHTGIIAPRSPYTSESDSQQNALTTLYTFPTLEPLRFLTYPQSHLLLPLRRDLLHRAVVFEGDRTRLGLASSKTRYEVHGTHAKKRPQKGSGRARMGSKQSPINKGGGKTFGPKPRDFATGLPRKVYDLAWRTALSWRYRRGELVVVEGAEMELGKTRVLRAVLGRFGWGKEGGRTTVVCGGVRRNLWKAFEGAGSEGRAMTVGEVDVKGLLETGRLVVEREALDAMLVGHQSDLESTVRVVV